MARAPKSISVLLVLIAVGTIAAVWAILAPPHRPAAPPAVARPATTAVAATPPIAAAPAPASYVDVIRVENPAVPATQPLGVPLDLSEAAHLVIRNPIYLDGAGMLWITQRGAPSVSKALVHPQDPPEHVAQERVVFVHWWLDDQGEWEAAAIVEGGPGAARGGGGGGGFTLVTATDRTALPVNRHFHWASAYSWQNRIVVPADTGVSVFDLAPALVEHYHALPGMGTGSNPAVTVLDARGVLAWAPWESGRLGSGGASRFVDGQWKDLVGGLWSPRPIQLMPLLDGSVLQIGKADPLQIAVDADVNAAPPGGVVMPDSVSLVIAPLDAANINAQHINDLVAQLGDPDDQKRESAFAELSRYGPSVAPMLEQLSQDQPPETRLRLRQLLRARVTPALDGLEIIGNRLAVARRQDDGTVLLYADAGVRVPRAGADEPETLSPAWLCVRPGGRVDPPLRKAIVADQRPDACTLVALRDDWLVCDDAGVRRFMGISFAPLTGPGEERFHRLIGQDRRGRWVIADGTAGSSETLIIDPTIADPSPRLPGWAMSIDSGSTGWDKENWPVIKRGGAWALKSDAWVPLTDRDPMLTQPPPPPPPPATTPPTTTNASTQPTSQAAPLGPVLLRTADGSCYFGGQTSLTLLDRHGRRIDWPLPPTAMGTISASLVRTDDGSLYLYNQPGRMLRVQPTGNAASPFRVSATFTRGIPNTDQPTRIWVDPLGRIDFVYDKTQLLILFPSGFIPPEIQRMMPQ